jgi:hypothetical protein
MDVRRFFRETLGAPYYRQRPAEILPYALAKIRFWQNRVREPEELLISLGFEPEACFAGYDRWRPVLEETVQRVTTGKGDQGGLSPVSGRFLYGVTRGLRPLRVIETGVAAGVSTSFIGAALLENGVGELYSIELPLEGIDHIDLDDAAVLHWPRKGVGWAIPEVIRDSLGERFHMVLEDVRSSLPAVLKQVKQVDLFIHDDLHTPDHMEWEFGAAAQTTHGSKTWTASRLCESGHHVCLPPPEDRLGVTR